MAKIKFQEPWEDREEAEETLEEEIQPLEDEEILEEETQDISEGAEELLEEELPESEPEPEPEPKKERLLARHIIPVDPRLAEELWGQPLTDEQRYQLEEDWALGFRTLTKAEAEWYGISDDPETYSNMESLSKNYLKIVANQGREDLVALESGAGEDGWPEGYLRDKNKRFTKECVAELLNMRDYAREYILPKEPDGRTDLRKYKRGDLNPRRKLRILNDQYGQRFDYWEAVRDRARRWRAWKEERDRAIPIVVEVNGEVAFGELLATPSNQAKVEQDISLAMQKIEQAEQLLVSVPQQLKESMWRSLEPHWTQLGLEIRAQGIAHTYDIVLSGKVEQATDEHDESTQPDDKQD